MSGLPVDTVTPILLAADEVYYPASDGQPMGETGFHVKLMTYLITMLRAYFRHREDVYVTGNVFVYYEKGNPHKFVAPDVFVVFGVEGFQLRERRSWFVWQEGKAPDVVFEFTSENTWQDDVGRKKALYESMGVREYFLFDPLHEHLSVPLQGYRLVKGRYEPIPAQRGRLVSRVLGLALDTADDELELYDIASGTPLLPPMAMAEALSQTRMDLDDAEGRAEEAAGRADEAEAKAEEAAGRAEEAEVKAEEAEARAAEEAAARRVLEARLATLEAELKRLRGE